MELKVLDHGYVRLIEAWGTGDGGKEENGWKLGGDLEVGIIEAARQSVGGGFVSWGPYEDHPKGDAGLLSFLHNNKHATPFEFAGMVLEVQAPIFVFREWHRHRTQSYNEASARYAPLPDLNYLPTPEAIVARSLEAAQSSNRQASGNGKVISLKEAQDWVATTKRGYEAQEWKYQEGLRLGVPKEIARIGMPVGHYSKMRASTNLRNWLGFLTLRIDPKAQWEIRQYAHAVADVVETIFPRTYELFKREREQ